MLPTVFQFSIFSRLCLFHHNFNIPLTVPPSLSVYADDLPALLYHMALNLDTRITVISIIF